MTHDDIDEFSIHEVIHTSHLVTDLFDRWVIQHLAVQADPELKAAAVGLGIALADFYQLVGERYSSHFDSK